ncbi:tetratricopeptide repeat protein [Bremerella sp. JC817]|uniref:tetratricopeptide repeat protein n=1 Tax=Bremerella sp. JC817 TaxID=3231756 RepID=UPI00345A5464
MAWKLPGILILFVLGQPLPVKATPPAVESRQVVLHKTALWATTPPHRPTDQPLLTLAPGDVVELQTTHGEHTQVRTGQRVGWLPSSSLTPLDTKAVEHFSAAIQANPDTAEAYLHRAKVHKRLGSWALAEADLEAALERNPKLAEALAARGYLHFRQGNRAEAKRDWDQAIAIDPQQTLALAYRGLIYASEGKFEQAIADQTAAIESDPTDPRLPYVRGLTWQRQNMPAKAIADFSLAIRLQPKMVLAWKHRSQAQRALGNIEQAKRDLETAIETDSLFVHPHGPERKRLDIDRSLPGMIEQLTAGIEFDPEDTTLIHNRGYLHVLNQNYQAAIQDFDTAIKQQPMATTFFLRGWSKRHLGQLEEAIADYGQAIERDPRLAAAYRDRAFLFKLQRKPELALADYTMAVQINPQDAASYYDRGLLREALSRREDALSDFSQVISIQSDHVDAYRHRAHVLVELKQFREAHRDLQRVKSLEATP